MKNVYPNNKTISYFQRNILEWYSDNKRNLPWRRGKLTVYQKMIAEVLLQRTKAETIARYYYDFLELFPNWVDIKKSHQNKIEKHLRPIGLYKQKSVLLKKLAVKMVKLNGRLPKERKEIEKLPLAGQYFTNAMILLIHNKPAPLLDVNMSRVLERFFGPRKLTDIRYDPYLQKLAWQIVNHKKTKEINWGILDYAASICKTTPICSLCKLNPKCVYFIKCK